MGRPWGDIKQDFLVVVMMRIVGLLLVSWLCDASDVVVLSDINFEHDTQASTGATTGDWFVKFYAPWCGHCTMLKPKWEKLATELLGEINIAEVDVTSDPILQRRFQIQSLPTLLYFRAGSMYKFTGARSYERLIQFVNDIHEEDIVPEGVVEAKVPREIKLQPWEQIAQLPLTEMVALALTGISIGFAIVYLFFRPRGDDETFAAEKFENIAAPLPETKKTK